MIWTCLRLDWYWSRYSKNLIVRSIHPLGVLELKKNMKQKTLHMLIVNTILSEHACTFKSYTRGSGSLLLRGSLRLFELPLYHACLMINCNMFKSSSKPSAAKTKQHKTNTEEEKRNPYISCVIYILYLLTALVLWLSWKSVLFSMAGIWDWDNNSITLCFMLLTLTELHIDVWGSSHCRSL